MRKIGVLVGSLSKRSYSQKVANYLSKIVPSSLTLVQLQYNILPFYNPDLEKQPPLEWQVFRTVVDQMAGLLIVTQEYNFSIPGGLKNALDVLSVPNPRPHIYQKPVLLLTDSAGERGGANANAHIQQSLRYMGMNVMNAFVTIGKVQEKFDANDQLIDPLLAKELQKTMADFQKFVNHSVTKKNNAPSD